MKKYFHLIIQKTSFSQSLPGRGKMLRCVQALSQQMCALDVLIPRCAGIKSHISVNRKCISHLGAAASHRIVLAKPTVSAGQSWCSRAALSPHGKSQSATSGGGWRGHRLPAAGLCARDPRPGTPAAGDAAALRSDGHSAGETAGLRGAGLRGTGLNGARLRGCSGCRAPAAAAAPLSL